MQVVNELRNDVIMHIKRINELKNEYRNDYPDTKAYMNKSHVGRILTKCDDIISGDAEIESDDDIDKNCNSKKTTQKRKYIRK